MREKWIDNIKFMAAGVFLCHYTESFAVAGAGIPRWLQCVNKFPPGNDYQWRILGLCICNFEWLFT